MSTALVRALSDRTATGPEQPLLLRRDAFGMSLSISHARFLREIQSFAEFFQTAGLERGGVLGIVAWRMSSWLAADCAAMALGAASVCIDPGSSVSTIVESLSFCRPNIVLVEDELILQALGSMGHRLPQIRHIIVLDPDFSPPTGKADSSWQVHCIADCFSLESFPLEVLSQNQPEDCAMLILSAGTDEEPRAVMWTHSAVTLQTAYLVQKLDIKTGTPVLQTLSPADPYCRLLVYAGLLGGWLQSLAQGPDPLSLIRLHKPLAYFGGESEWEELAGVLSSQGRIIPGLARFLFRLDARLAASKAWFQPIVQGLRSLFDLVFIRRYRVTQLGQLELGSCRGDNLALAGREVLASAGLRLLNVFIQPESGIVGAGSPRFPVDGLGLFPGTAIEIRDSGGMAITGKDRGQLFVQGPNLMKGYLRQPLKSREAIDRTGWLATGQSAHLDSSDRLVVHGMTQDVLRVVDGSFVDRKAVSSLLRLLKYIDSVSLGLTDAGQLLIGVRIRPDLIREHWHSAAKGLPDAALSASMRVQSLMRHEINQLLLGSGFNKNITSYTLEVN